MDILTNRQYLLGVATGVVAVYLWHGYKAKKAAGKAS